MRLSKRQLEAEIRKLRERNCEAGRRGRKPTPPLVKALSRIQKDLVFTMVHAEEATLDTLSKERAEKLLEELEKQVGQVWSVVATLKNRL